MHTVCGGVAFLYERDQWVSHGLAAADFAEHADGTPMLNWEPMVCDNCGAKVNRGDFERTLRMEPEND